ncbi:MAG: hypothetical protein WD795_08450 [Woeseia sp.]
MAAVLLALCFSLPAIAELKTLVEAKETSTAFMNVPTTDNSRLTFKGCEECELISVRLTPATEYFLRGEAMLFADFRKHFNNLRRSKEDYALVTYDTETNTVKSVRVAD